MYRQIFRDVTPVLTIMRLEPTSQKIYALKRKYGKI